MNSALFNLEPICSMAFAINMIYLTVEGFFVSDKISQKARSILRTSLHSEHSAVSNDARYLANLNLDEGFSIEPSENLKRQNWFLIYSNQFFSGLDRKLSAYCCLFSASLMILGVADTVGWSKYTKEIPIFGDFLDTLFLGQAHYLLPMAFGISILCLLFPALLAMFGKRVNIAADKFFDSIIEKQAVALDLQVRDSFNELSDRISEFEKERAPDE